MDMGIFQVKSNRALPAKGRILIASPLLSDYFTRTVILMITHNEEGSMGLVMNQSFRHHVTLNQLVPGLGATSDIPIFKGGPVGRDTIFFIHSLETLDGALEISDGLYLNGDFEELKEYIRQGNPVRGHIRFFAGYAGWDNGQLQEEIRENCWMVGESRRKELLDCNPKLWKESMDSLGPQYSIWAKYPIDPSLN